MNFLFIYCNKAIALLYMCTRLVSLAYRIGIRAVVLMPLLFFIFKGLHGDKKINGRIRRSLMDEGSLRAFSSLWSQDNHYL